MCMCGEGGKGVWESLCSIYWKSRVIKVGIVMASFRVWQGGASAPPERNLTPPERNLTPPEKSMYK